MASPVTRARLSETVNLAGVPLASCVTGTSFARVTMVASLSVTSAVAAAAVEEIV